MKKIFNNKGMTLVEIILSIGLVSIVMVQVLNILVDLKNEQLLGKDKTQDLTNRSVIIKTVQDDFRNKGVKSVSKCSSGVGSYTSVGCVSIVYKNNDQAKLFTATKSGSSSVVYFVYATKLAGAASYTYEAWKLGSGKYKHNTGNCGFNFKYKIYSKSSDKIGKTYFKILFPVALNSANVKSSMTFDLEFLYYADTYNSANAITISTTGTTQVKGCTV